MKIKDRGWLSEEAIEIIEKTYNAKYCLFTEIEFSGRFTEGVHVFYVENPDVSKGHTHYFYIRQNYYTYRDVDDRNWVIGGFDWKEMSIEGLDIDGEFWYSATRHDYVETPINVAIDGGRCYTRIIGDGCNIKYKTIIFTEDGMKFKEN